ncbi:hypothetical protein PCANB_001747 [Pneumocystis canis]|nr:hypothetical protein PCANB_001747 [Pneumocystis canis]
MDSAESTHYFCHACTSEFVEAAQCPTCGSDFIERIEVSDDPRLFTRSPRMTGWAWSFGHRPVALCMSTASMTTGAPVNTTNTADTTGGTSCCSDTMGGVESTGESSENGNMPRNTDQSMQDNPEGSSCGSSIPHISLSTQFETMLQNILSSIVGSNATVDIALCNTSGRQEGQAETHTTSSEETERPRPSNFIFRRSFFWSNHPSEHQETSQSENIEQNVEQNTEQNVEQNVEQNTEHSAGQNAEQRSSQNIHESTRTARIPIHDLATFLENAFGSGFSDNGLAGPLSGFFSNVFTMRNPGDYVWSSTGFDNIITQLMEQYPSTNAPPPASDEVINALPKMMVQEEEELRDCAICKENYQPKETYITLPCKHYFHDNCIIPWLKINNTCAICRATVGTNVLNQFSGPESEHKEKDDKSKDSDHNMSDQLEQEPPD